MEQTAGMIHAVEGLINEMKEAQEQEREERRQERAILFALIEKIPK